MVELKFVCIWVLGSNNNKSCGDWDLGLKSLPKDWWGWEWTRTPLFTRWVTTPRSLLGSKVVMDTDLSWLLI